MSIDSAISTDDLRRMAKWRLPRIAFDFIEGGVEDERGLDRNREAFARHRLVPRYLVDIARRDQSVTLFGRTYASPLGISPMGLANLFHPGCDLILARAAAAANIPYCMSSASNDSIEAAAKVAPHHTWLQVYGTRDRSFSQDLMRRAQDVGVETLVVTVDVPVSAKRERNLRNGFTRPLKLRPRIVLDALGHPVWLYRYLRGGGVPMMQNWQPYAQPGASADTVADLFAAQTPGHHTWADFEATRRLWTGNLLIKGVLHPDDARRAVELGADGIFVSNHGGRQLDRAPSPLDMLPAIREAVGDRARIVMDSGVRRGSDAVVARCLGAEIAFMGRTALYGAVAGGLRGATRTLDILRAEIDLTLGQIGCASVAALGPEMLHG